MPVTIRHARIDDLPSILSIYNDAILNTTATFDLEAQTLAEREIWFRQFGDRYPLLIAESDGHVAGYCGLTSFRSKPAYARTAEISIYIDREFRGQRIGTALLDRMLPMAAELGFHVIIAGITGGNVSSVRLHEKFGFEFIGAFREVGYKFDAWQDVWFYQKILHQPSK
jgi:L-amino acid N-acyltransferase YncA